MATRVDVVSVIASFVYAVPTVGKKEKENIRLTTELLR